MQEPIKFDWLGIHLQEPMAMITNMLLSLFCLFAFLQLRKMKDDQAIYRWKLFYLLFGISTFFGALGHGFFLYFGIFGKYPCWTLGFLANAFAAKAMLSFKDYSQKTQLIEVLIWSKSLLLMTLALISQKFIFVAIDAIITYLSFTGGYAIVLLKKGLTEMWFMIIGVLVLLPSAFIFLLKLNPHRWLNKDDLSHLFMLGCIACFYFGMKAWNKRLITVENNV